VAVAASVFAAVACGGTEQARAGATVDDPRAFLLYERYTDEDAFQAHRRTPHFGDIIERQVAPLLEERAWTRVEPLPA
jgi:quinol monooxygenase YgiN